MSKPKPARNARIVRLRDAKRPRYHGKAFSPLSWSFIARTVSDEFPDDPVSRSRVRFIYLRETEGGN